MDGLIWIVVFGAVVLIPIAGIIAWAVVDHGKRKYASVEPAMVASRLARIERTLDEVP